MKHLTGFLALFLFASLTLYAADLSDLAYTTTGGEVTITDCDRAATGELVIPDTIEEKSVTSIGNKAFHFCTSLTSITIPDSVTSIRVAAFRNCTSLTSVTIGGSVTSIESAAFECCTSLTSITIPDSVTSIGSSAFDLCTSLTTIEVGAGNGSYAGYNGVLFNKEKTTLHTYPAGKTGGSYTIPDSVTSIEADAFQSCTSLTSISIGNGVTGIGEWAFADCSSLTSFTIPDGVTSIGRAAFQSCTSLTSITIGNGVTNIGDFAFERCTSLTVLTFLGDVPKAGREVFSRGATPTIYRKPEAKGWGETWGGMPVKLISEKP